MAVEKVPFFHDPFLQQILEDDATLGQEPLRSKMLASQTDVQHFNRQLERFGLTENSIKVLASNNIQGHISWQILVDREAYIRALQKYMLPTQYWSELEQNKLEIKDSYQQKINDQKTEALKRFNSNQTYYNQKKAFIREQLDLMGYINFLKSIYFSAYLLIQDRKDRAQFAQLIENISQEQINITSDLSNDIKEIEAQIKAIDDAIQQCETSLIEVQRYKKTLAKEIKAQEIVVAELIEHIEACDEEIKKFDGDIEEQLELTDNLEEQIENKESEQVEAEVDLSKLAQKKSKVIAQKEAFEDEMALHHKNQGEHEAAYYKLTEQAEEADTPEEKKELSKQRDAAFTELTVSELFAMQAALEFEDTNCDAKIEKYISKESNLAEHIIDIKQDIKSLKEKLRTSNQELAYLHNKKQALADKRTALSAQLNIEQDKLQALQQEFDQADKQEVLLKDNIKSYKDLKTCMEVELQTSKDIAAINKEEKHILKTYDDNVLKLERADKALTGVKSAFEKTMLALDAKYDARETLEPGSKAYNKNEKEIAKAESQRDDMKRNVDKQSIRKFNAQEIVDKQDTQKQVVTEKIVALTQKSALNNHKAQEIQYQINQRESQRQALQRTANPMLLKNPEQQPVKPHPITPTNLYADLHPSQQPSAPLTPEKKIHDPYASLHFSQKPSAPPEQDIIDPHAPSAPPKTEVLNPPPPTKEETPVKNEDTKRKTHKRDKGR